MYFLIKSLSDADITLIDNMSSKLSVFKSYDYVARDARISSAVDTVFFTELSQAQVTFLKLKFGSDFSECPPLQKSQAKLALDAIALDSNVNTVYNSTY